MTTEKLANQTGLTDHATSADGKWDTLLGRLDLVAVVTAFAGACLLGIVALVLAVIGLAKLISTLWADSIDRWLLVALVLAGIWIIARGKKLCVF